jgi:acetyltransferase-like isoleucine patch superfamily enzyme
VSALHLLLKSMSRLAQRLRGLRLWGLVRLCGGQCTGVPRVEQGVVFRYPPHAGLRFGEGLFIGPHCVFDLPPGSTLHIGDRASFAAGVHISAIESITIGDDCLVAEGVSIRDSQHGYERDIPIRLQPLSASPVKIGDDVWIGRGSAVLQGAQLGDGCVVGADSQMRSGEYSANGIYVGVPARRLKERPEPTDVGGKDA